MVIFRGRRRFLDDFDTKFYVAEAYLGEEMKKSLYFPLLLLIACTDKSSIDEDNGWSSKQVEKRKEEIEDE